MQILCFFFFYSRAAVSVVFPPCCPVQVLSFALCLHHVFLSEQIKMMMIIDVNVDVQRNSRRRPKPRLCAASFYTLK